MILKISESIDILKLKTKEKIDELKKLEKESEKLKRM